MPTFYDFDESSVSYSADGGSSYGDYKKSRRRGSSSDSGSASDASYVLAGSSSRSFSRGRASRATSSANDFVRWIMGYVNAAMRIHKTATTVEKRDKALDKLQEKYNEERDMLFKHLGLHVSINMMRTIALEPLKELAEAIKAQKAHPSVASAATIESEADAAVSAMTANVSRVTSRVTREDAAMRLAFNKAMEVVTQMQDRAGMIDNGIPDAGVLRGTVPTQEAGESDRSFESRMREYKTEKAARMRNLSTTLTTKYNEINKLISNLEKAGRALPGSTRAMQKTYKVIATFYNPGSPLENVMGALFAPGPSGYSKQSLDELHKTITDTIKAKVDVADPIVIRIAGITIDSGDADWSVAGGNLAKNYSEFFPTKGGASAMSGFAPPVYSALPPSLI